MYFVLSAGVGRTGTYIALDIPTEQGKLLGYVDVFAFVAALREQRVNMVQTLVSFTLHYNLACACTEKFRAQFFFTYHLYCIIFKGGKPKVITILNSQKVLHSFSSIKSIFCLRLKLGIA